MQVTRGGIVQIVFYVLTGDTDLRRFCSVPAFSANGKDVIVDFPQQSHWTGLLSEMELVPSVHPGVT